MKKLEKLYKIKHYIILCPNRIDATKLCQVFDELNLKWCDGTQYTTHNDWNIYKEQTCYNPYNGMFGRLEYYNSDKGREQVGHKYAIITVDEFIKLF